MSIAGSAEDRSSKPTYHGKASFDRAYLANNQDLQISPVQKSIDQHHVNPRKFKVGWQSSKTLPSEVDLRQPPHTGIWKYRSLWSIVANHTISQATWVDILAWFHIGITCQFQRWHQLQDRRSWCNAHFPSTLKTVEKQSEARRGALRPALTPYTSKWTLNLMQTHTV